MGILDDKLKGIPYAGMNAGNNNYNQQADLQKISNSNSLGLPYAGMNAGNNNYNPQADLQKISNSSIFSNGTSPLLNSLSNGINNIGNGISNAINTQQTQLNPIVNQQAYLQKISNSNSLGLPYAGMNAGNNNYNPQADLQKISNGSIFSNGTSPLLNSLSNGINNIGNGISNAINTYYDNIQPQSNTVNTQQTQLNPIVNQQKGVKTDGSYVNNTQQLTLDELRNRNPQLPANYDTTQGRADYLMGTLQKQQPLVNPIQPINSPMQQGIKYQNVQPFKTIFDSNGATNQQPANPYMNNFEFNQDTYNQGLRDTSTQGYQDARSNFLNVANNIKDASIADMMQMAIIGNQYRQDMRKNQADFTNANSLASKNLEQQNDNGLKDLISQRSSFLDDKRLTNDDARLRMEQEKFNQQQLQTNTENTYKQDYLNKYLLPQLNQQQANQNAQMQFQRDLNSGTILDNQNKVQLYNNLDKIEEMKRNAYQQAIKDYKPISTSQTVINKDGSQTQTSSLLDKGTVLKFKMEQLLNSNPEYNDLDNQTKQLLLRQSIGQPSNKNNVSAEYEVQDQNGGTVKYKGTQKQIDEIKNNNSIAIKK